jgi:aspartyl-tRNA(Asn)/glutamyl-tRNA(Gln) amidotransferase subunit C
VTLSRDEVVHVASLAHVGLSEAEIDRMASELSSVLEHVDKLAKVDTSGVDPTSHVVVMGNVVRADEPSESWSVEMALANAPLRRGDFFEVQAILD